MNNTFDESEYSLDTLLELATSDEAIGWLDSESDEEKHFSY